MINISDFQGLDLNNEQPKVDFDTARIKNISSRINDRKFREEIAAICKRTTPKARIALRNFAFQKNRVYRLNTSSLVLLTHKFREFGDFKSIVRLYERCSNDQFRHSPVGMENVANAYNRVGDFDKTIAVCKKINEQNYSGSFLKYNLEGTAWYMKGSAAERLNDLEKDDSCTLMRKNNARKIYLKFFPDDKNCSFVKENATLAKKNALLTFQKGFRKNMDSFSGLKTATVYLEMGNLQKAKEFAKLTLLVCERDGGLEVADYQRAETMAIAAILSEASPKNANKILDRLNEAPATVFQRRAGWYEIANIKQKLDAQGKDTKLATALLERLNESLKNLVSSSYNEASLKKAKPEKDLTPSELLLKKTFNYRGLPGGFITSSCISGNFNFDGQVPDHSVGRVDWEQFDKLLDVPVEKIIDNNRLNKITVSPDTTLRQIADPEIFSVVADQIVRSAFSPEARGIETLNNDTYDSYVHSVTFLSGIGKIDKAVGHVLKYEEKKGSDSTTSISTSFALGLGDCRHHAQAKQLLCDVWQRSKMNLDLQYAIFSVLNNNENDKNDAINSFLGKLETDFKTYDMSIIAPISKEKRKEGFFVSDKPETIESHTGMLRFDFNAKFVDGMVARELKYIAFCDPFYQGDNGYDKHIYSLNQGIVKASDLVKDKDGDVVLPANPIIATNPETQEKVVVPVITKPVGYASNLDPAKSQELDRKVASRLRLDYKDTGNNMYLGGLAIPTINLSERLIQSKEFRETNSTKGHYHPWLQKVHQWTDDASKSSRKIVNQNLWQAKLHQKLSQKQR